MSERTRGLYLEELEVGHTYVSRERVITQADVDAFADVSGDHNPLHTDPAYGATTIFGECVAHGALGYAAATGLANEMGLFLGTDIAFLGCSLTYPNPLRIGATVHLEMTPTEVRPSSSKPDRGVVTLSVKLVNAEGAAVMDSEWKIMMKRVPAMDSRA